MAGPVAALSAVVMMVVWVAYIAQTVLALTEPSVSALIAWGIATPVVIAVELGGWAILERLAEVK